tara:strand:- start:1476 stop:1850 length:375 start_codon:yes stop_codon:yes gene_type:complete
MSDSNYVTIELDWDLKALASLAGAQLHDCYIANTNHFYAPVTKDVLTTAKQTYMASAATYAANQKWAAVRLTRNEKLSESDWTQVVDSQLSSSKQIEWRAYRQQLRDITKQSDPANITWPTEPS